VVAVEHFAARAADAALEQVADLAHRGEVAVARDHERRHAHFAEPFLRGRLDLDHLLVGDVHRGVVERHLAEAAVVAERRPDLQVDVRHRREVSRPLRLLPARVDVR
jgi:hypothetical protein